MGPAFVQAAKAGSFDRPAWTAAMEIADARDVDQAIAAIGAQRETFAALLADLDDADFRAEGEIFGNPRSYQVRSARGTVLTWSA